MNQKLFFLIIISVIFSLPQFAAAEDVLGQTQTFNIESSYDIAGRSQLIATLVKISPQLYWYLDKDWWEKLNSAQQEEIRQSLSSLSEEFEGHIYPKLTQTFGSEWSPGIDRDTRLTILAHAMPSKAGGYFDSADEYPKSQIPESNEREMIYFNSQHITSPIAKSLISHEFMHLITFNQKEKNLNLVEDIWLNEGRAEYAPTLLGYEQDYENSNLQRRVKDFLDKPFDSLTEWRNTAADYGVLNLFIQSLVDHYGVKILSESLKIRKSGIASLNAVLSQEGFKEDFSQIFTDWAITILLNDCQVSEKYCYLNPNLRNFRITPLINYLPFVGESKLSVTNTTKDWAGNWHKFIGGKGTLKLEFQSASGTNFKVPYLIQDAAGNLSVKNLILDENRQGQIVIEDFGVKNTSLTIIPLVQNKISGFTDWEPSRSFSWVASTYETAEENIPSIPPAQKPISEMTKAELIARISEIQKLIAQIQTQLNSLLGVSASCTAMTEDLYLGLANNSQVRCLQEFLMAQGPEIYPEGLVTGNFLTLTQQAVIRFQEKYLTEILAPLGLKQGTGYVGVSTRAKINQLLTK